ncbi:MAG: hypothetical protein M3347_05275, partial [Armatimonadota bacterium]|nr:hypothetical protein [Armatimonadota bacterium]
LQMRTKVDTSQWAEAMEVTYTAPDGQTIRMKYQDDQDRADVSIDGAAVSFDNWPVYSGPYLNAQNMILSVNDGQDGFIVDFTGDLPVYKPWTRTEF